MTRRFRLVAGPNGSGKSTLVGRLANDYAVNFYLRLNADDIFAQVRRDGLFPSPFPVDGAALVSFASGLEMRYLAAYDETSGLSPQMPASQFPRWFSVFSAAL